MKPPLESAPLTAEDEDIWERVIGGQSLEGVRLLQGMRLAHISRFGDARDVNMMLKIEIVRRRSAWLRPANYHRCMVHSLMCACLREFGTFDWH